MTEFYLLGRDARGGKVTAIPFAGNPKKAYVDIRSGSVAAPVGVDEISLVSSERGRVEPWRGVAKHQTKQPTKGTK